MIDAHNTKTVLVVDDEPVLRHTLGKLLKDMGFRVVLAQDGPSGVDAGRQHPVDIVVTDFIMPGLDGWQTLEALRKTAPQLPAIVMTALPEEHWNSDGNNNSAITKWVQKPVAFCQLLKLISEISNEVKHAQNMLTLCSNN